MSKVYRYEFRVGENAVDANGHVNNVEYVRWMQEAAIAHSNEAGCTEATKAAGAIWVVRTHRVEYLRPAFAGEKIAVLTWVCDFRRVRSLRKYKFVRVRDDVVLAKGESDWVFVDGESGNPRSIPEDVLGAFELVAEGAEP
jgi:acyl-CoA thioester hydrolase